MKFYHSIESKQNLTEKDFHEVEKRWTRSWVKVDHSLDSDTIGRCNNYNPILRTKGRNTWQRLDSRLSLSSVLRDRVPVESQLIEIESSFQSFQACVFLRENCAEQKIKLPDAQQHRQWPHCTCPWQCSIQRIWHCLLNALSSLLLHWEECTRGHFPAIPESSCPGQGREEFLAQNFEINLFADDLVDRSPYGALPEIECRLGAPKREKSRRVSLCPSVRAASQHVGRPLAYVVTVVRFFDLIFRGFWWSHPTHGSQHQHTVQHLILSRSARSTLSHSTTVWAHVHCRRFEFKNRCAKEWAHSHMVAKRWSVFIVPDPESPSSSNPAESPSSSNPAESSSSDSPPESSSSRIASQSTVALIQSLEPPRSSPAGEPSRSGDTALRLGAQSRRFATAA